jgi:hypothetical protein
MARGLAFLAAYTWSKSVDDLSAVFSGNVGSGLPQDSENRRTEHGLSDFHALHRFAFSYLYDLPFGGGRQWANGPGLGKHLLGNWQVGGILTLQTGHPFTVNRGATLAGTALTAFGIPDRPDLLADPFRPGPVPSHSDSACHSTQSQGGRAADRVRQPQSWFNPCAFDTPKPGRFGSAGRNNVIGPGVSNLDFSLSRSFPLRKGERRLQLRAESFNLLNHPNFDIPNRTFDAPTFATVLSANLYGNKPPRQTQLGFRYVF